MLVYVDDTLTKSPDTPAGRLALSKLVHYLSTRFRFEHKGEATEYTGIRIQRKSKHEIKLSMNEFATSTVAKHGLESSRRAPAPATPNVVLTETDCPSTDAEREEMAGRPYKNRVGDMSWLSRCMRPDLAYATNALARLAHNPGTAHWNASTHLIRHLNATTDVSITYRRTGKPLYIYVDSDYLPNYGTRFDNLRSTTGWVAFFGGAAVRWASRRQDGVANSTCEAEYYAAHDAACSALQLRTLLSDLGHPQLDPTPLLEDNQACIKLASNPFANNRKTAHIESRYHRLRQEVVSRRTIRFVYVQSSDQCADGLTKPLPLATSRRFQRAMSGVEPLPLPPLDGPPGRIGLSVTRPDLLPTLSSV
jgi:hypothetical protein